MKILRLSLVLLALAALTACGGEKQESKTPSSAPTEPDTPKSPKDYGVKVGEIHRDAIAAVVDDMRDRPEPGALRPEMEKLKEETIQELVVLGKAREAMSEADREKMDSAIRTALFTTPRELYAEYTEGQKHYAGIDRELGNLLASFNTITQYAAFELLKKQLPDEAKRLGIE